LNTNFQTLKYKKKHMIEIAYNIIFMIQSDIYQFHVEVIRIDLS